MTKEQLEALGLNEEQIAEVFKLNGIAVNNAKGDLAAKETELETKTKEVETLQGQLETANTEIESYKEMDVEAIKAAADDYKTKYEAAKTEAEKEIESLKFEHSLESALNKAGAKNVKAAKALLNIEELKDSKNIDVDIETAITTLKESDDYLFGQSDPQGTGGSLGNGGKGTGKSITKEEFDKMSYSEKVELYNKDQELYKELTN